MTRTFHFDGGRNAMSEKSDFCKAVVILLDTREQDIAHITGALDKYGVRFDRCKLDLGDITFELPTRTFTQSCVIERKADPDELYSNIMEKVKPPQIGRLEKELDAASRSINQFTMLIEGVGSMEELKAYCVPDWKMKAAQARVRSDIGAICYARLRAWQAANRYNFRVECVRDRANTAARVLDEFYYYFHNYRAAIAPRR